MKRVVSGVATVYIVEREPVAIDSGHTVANTTGSHLRSHTLHQSPCTNHHHSHHRHHHHHHHHHHHTYYIAVLRTAVSLTCRYVEHHETSPMSSLRTGGRHVCNAKTPPSETCNTDSD